MKKTLSFIIIYIFIGVIFSPVLAQPTLKAPQGRMGLGYKPEKYSPILRTNLTKAELEKIGSIIKQEKDAQRQAVQEEKQATKNAQQAYYNNLKQQKKAKEIARQNAIKAQKQQEKLAQERENFLLKQEALKQKEKLAQEKLYQKELKIKEKMEEEAVLQKEREIFLAQKQKEQEEKRILKQQQEQEKAEAKRVALLEKEQEKIALQEKEETINKTESKLNFFTKITSKQKEAVTEQSKTEENNPETVVDISEEQKLAIKKITDSQRKTPQDPETKRILEEVSNELNSERPKMLEELSLLWVNAVQKSDTVYFAIMKLSNPNGEEVNKNGFKKILEPIIGAAPLVGQAFVNPAMTAGSLIGSNVLGTMMNDNATKRLTRVNDADLVILARAIDELQETLLLNYMEYKSAKKEYELAIKITEERQKAYEELNKSNSPQVILANTFYTEALDNQYKARQDFLMKRVILEQMVGAEALQEIENTQDKTTANAE